MVDFLNLRQIEAQRNSCYNILSSSLIWSGYCSKIILNSSLYKLSLTIHPINPFMNNFLNFVFQIHFVVKLNFIFLSHMRTLFKVQNWNILNEQGVIVLSLMLFINLIVYLILNFTIEQEKDD